MAHSSKQDMNIHLVPKSISFSVFTKEQIKKLAVMKIVSPLMLDSLGHPLPGGLYDARLGPYSDNGDLCGTCRKTLMNCPGHFGYIELPLPVVNPLFDKIISSILRISCFSCHLIQLPIQVKSCLRIQLKLLNVGLVSLALEVENRMTQLIQQYGSYESIPNNDLDSIISYERTAEDMSEGLEEINVLNQNTETLHNQFVNNILRNFKQGQSCMYCEKAINKIQAFKTKFIMSVRKIDLENSSTSRGVRQRVMGVESKFINPHECRQMIRDIWQAEKDFIKQLAPVLKGVDADFPTDVFFFDVLPVTPSNIRPVNIVQGRIIENKQTITYKNILQNIILLKTIIYVVQKKGDENTLNLPEAKEAYTFAQGNTPTEKLQNAWEELQKDVNGIVDRESKRNTEGEGLKQLIEKKEGIIRMNMMGKRVNYSARSVITPDPNLNIDEIGIPEEFAKKLTYPVPVTPWNVEQLRKMVLNGPDVHPGAVKIELNGLVTRITNDPKQQKTLMKCLLTSDDRELRSSNIKIVHRHLCNGDVLLVNRQPTLHKPSIMAHTARILKGEKTLRLHYSNCNAYNADFDGDEMNVHLPQNELARSEGYHIVNVSNQYLVPKDGTPLSGLIQDYITAGVRMSIRGRFFNRVDYQQLVFQALSYMNSEIVLLPPAIIKPKELWSGKQILSTVIINIIPKGRAPINLTATSKISAEAWQTVRPREWAAGGTPFSNPNTMTETEVIIRGGELHVGVLEKSHYGATPYGLVHCIHELYGGTYAARILSSLAKLFTRFLQQEGFTLGVRDIRTVAKADAKRLKIINKSRKIGAEVVAAVLKLPADTPPETLLEEIEKAEAVNPKIRTLIDWQYKTELNSYTNRINKACLPAGLICKFPENNLQLMVQSGAKGSTVNTMQISCLLGQIELEGKRPPLMISGKSLPSFPAFEFAPRAGGFIDGRFMSGIPPQEFFFHCMAGREGLIDTAVKTSRSGYLQRCLIKHLEGLHIAYDMTVRNSDNSVIQFKYGEDGLDVCKAQFLNEKQLNFLKENDKAIRQRDLIKELKKTEEYKEIKAYQGAIKLWKRVLGDPLKKNRVSPYTVLERIAKSKLPKFNVTSEEFTKEVLQMLWYEVDDDVRKECAEKCVPCPDPVDCVFQPDCHYGSINERLQQMIENYDVPKKKKFEETMKLKIMQSMAVPGEPVGMLAAQSIGEPSTQMTLNTFHFAGRGEMNVTLGIPRLREILMMASKNIKTPYMEIPFLDVPALEVKAETLRKMLSRVSVSDVLEKIDVTSELQWNPKRQYMYTLRFQFLPKRYYSKDYSVQPWMIIDHMKKKFFGEMFAAIRKFTKINCQMVMIENEKSKKKEGRKDADAEEEGINANENAKAKRQEDQSSSEDEVEDEEDAKATNKFKQVHEDQEPEEEEREVSDDDEESEADNEESQQQSNEENKQQQPTEATAEKKRAKKKDKNAVSDSFNFAQNYREDGRKFRWCEITFAFPLTPQPLHLRHLLKETAAKSILWETPNIKKAITYKKENKLMLRTDGINIVEMFKYDKLLDLKKLYCNDIHKMAEAFGIEAASKIIVKEVRDVFNVYGIKIDPRHLSLIADYMTYNGTYDPLSRKGMESSVSPLQQISFESSLTFLKNATVRGKQDNLQNPSSSIMIGNPCVTGTGSFALLSSQAAAKD